MPNTESPQNTIFYNLDRCIKSYRQFAQRNITNAGLDITIDQWLILNGLESNPETTQNEIAELVFKDNASLTRIIDLLVKKKLINRSASKADRRRYTLTLTAAGKDMLAKATAVSLLNRKAALKNIPADRLTELTALLNQIVQNINNAETV